MTTNPRTIAAPDAAAEIALDVLIDLPLTCGPWRRCASDPTVMVEPQRVVRATRTRAGPGTVELGIVADGPSLRVRAWGPGAADLVTRAGRLVGLDDDPDVLLRLAPPDPLVRELARRFAGLRFGRTDAVLETLVPAIVEQKVTGVEARTGWRGLVLAHGEAAPGPFGLRLAPAPARLADLPYHAFHRLGIEQRRAERIRRVATLADRLEATVGLPLSEAYARLTAVPGIGPWTAAEVGRVAFGDPDAVSVGDYHVPNTVAWALRREPRADDARLLELLAPYAGQRGRVVRLIEAAGFRAPRRGPRMAPRSIARI